MTIQEIYEQTNRINALIGLDMLPPFQNFTKAAEMANGPPRIPTPMTKVELSRDQAVGLQRRTLNRFMEKEFQDRLNDLSKKYRGVQPHAFSDDLDPYLRDLRDITMTVH